MCFDTGDGVGLGFKAVLVAKCISCHAWEVVGGKGGGAGGGSRVRRLSCVHGGCVALNKDLGGNSAAHCGEEGQEKFAGICNSQQLGHQACERERTYATLRDEY